MYINCNTVTNKSTEGYRVTVDWILSWVYWSTAVRIALPVNHTAGCYTLQDYTRCPAVNTLTAK